MSKLQLFGLIIGNSLLFFSVLSSDIQNFSYGKYALLLVPAALSLGICRVMKRQFGPVPKYVVLLLVSLPLEYAFLLTFYLPGTLWGLLYLAVVEFFRARIFMLALGYSPDPEWRCRLARVYFIPAAANTFNWVLFARGPGPVFFPWLMPVFASGWTALVFSMFQLTVYDVVRPKIRLEGEPSRTRGEQIAAWIAYCVSGYREPAREVPKNDGMVTRKDKSKAK